MNIQAAKMTQDNFVLDLAHSNSSTVIGVGISQSAFVEKLNVGEAYF